MRFSLSRLSLFITSFAIILGFAQEASAFRVVIDAGHGGRDKGATQGAYFEKHLAMDTALRLRRYLRSKGIPVTLTRSRDRYIGLGARAAIANRYRDAIFVSVHYNSAANRDATGSETFYYSQADRPLAQYVQYYMNGKLRNPNRGVKRRGFKVIRSCSRPSILVEPGFMSNRRELSRFLRPSQRQKVAEAIGTGIIRYRRAKARGRF
ncbi:MAG: N-acetylmuramoyl-L-alanine amidase [Verrucomicrobiota bacterium]